MWVSILQALVGVDFENYKANKSFIWVFFLKKFQIREAQI